MVAYVTAQQLNGVNLHNITGLRASTLAPASTSTFAASTRDPSKAFSSAVAPFCTCILNAIHNDTVIAHK